MKQLFALLFVAILGLCATGCSTLLPLQAKTQIAAGVNKYCNEVDPLTRMVLRQDVNTMIAPNSIKVTCAKDTEPAPAVAQ